ncbi:UNVERIFIED_CONTAM: hypothetical protein GTU68_029004 [Idotea baltica]|nr:hypothetical protein [Idotea baltica]
MCRWAAYHGARVYIDELLFHPSHSLIEQSRAASECKTAINADGFGLAWYQTRREPGLYRDVYPAWSDPNLKSLATQIQTGLFLAHVRASTGSATSRNNCHPFSLDKWAFMHNGQVGGFDQFRKRGDMLIADDLYHCRKGATDSEVLFLLALEYGLDHDPIGALERATVTLESLSREFGHTPHMRLSAALSDGENLYAVRYASDDFAPSLYYRYCDTKRGWSVVSEPLDETGADWIAVPNKTLCCFSKDGVTQHPFLAARSMQICA